MKKNRLSPNIYALFSPFCSDRVACLRQKDRKGPQSCRNLWGDGLYQFEMPEGVEDAVVIDGGGDMCGLCFQRLVGITHCDADARCADHGEVVAAIAEGHRVLRVEAQMTGHRQDAFTLIGAFGGDIGKGRVPATRGATGNAGHQLFFVVGREEGRELQDALLEHYLEGLHLIKVLNGYLLTEDLIDLSLRVDDSHIMFAYDDDAVILLDGIIDHQLGCLVGDILTAHGLLAYEAQGPVDRDITIDEMLDGTKVGDDQWWATSSDEHLVPIGLGLRECKYGRGRYLVSIETYQRSVDIEKQCVTHE